MSHTKAAKAVRVPDLVDEEAALEERTDEAATEEEESDGAPATEEEEGPDDADLNPFGDKWEE